MAQYYLEIDLSLQGRNDLAMAKYMSLQAQNDKIQVEYIWIGGNGELRGKTKTINKKEIKDIKELPIWNYDGSSTEQASGNDSEVILKPVKIVPCPFRKGNNLLCLCETYEGKTFNEKETPLPTNKRYAASKIFEEKSVKDEEPWYGIEQEYTMINLNFNKPLGFPSDGFPAPQGPYYCSVGTKTAFGRQVAEAHYRACLFAGIAISGINAEVMPGQWEFQVGPCVGIDSGDQLWLARYILQRVAEDFGVEISYDPKPVKGDWNGTGAHTNYSTKSMREGIKNDDEKKNEIKSGYEVILSAIQKLSVKHDEHMELYGLGNKERLTGKHETASWKSFKAGVADRGASIRIPRQTEIDNKGYFEDRRPAANCDPYEVTSKIAKTTILDDIQYEPQDDDKQIPKHQEAVSETINID